MQQPFITPEMYFGSNHYEDLKNKPFRSVFESKKGDLKFAFLESADYLKDSIVGAYNKLLEEYYSDEEIKPTSIKTTWFKNLEVRVDINENIDGGDVYIFSSPFNPNKFYTDDNSERRTVNDYTMELLNSIEVVKRHGGNAVPVVFYLPYSRQDKPDYMERQSGGASLLAKMIETAGASRMIGFNFHAPQLKEYFNIPVDESDMSRLFSDYFSSYGNREDTMIIGPDAGSLKWIKRVARNLGLRYSSADKVRTAPNTAQVDDINADFRGIEKVIMLDDMWDTVGTAKGAIEFLVDNTNVREVSLASFFPLLNDPAPERIQSLIDEGIVTDLVTMPTMEQRDKVKDIELYHELPIQRYIARLVNKRHYANSIKSTFEDFKVNGD